MNTFHFTCTAIDEGTRNAIQASLVDFYEAFDTYKSSRQDWANARLRWFDLSDPEPREPVEDELFGLTSGTATPVAREIAVCCSFAGDFVSGFPASRRRGRVYLGPIGGTCWDSVGLLAPSLVTAVVTGANLLLSDSNAASDWAWVVYSPTGNTAYPVTSGWVDNAPDIQRRRGTAATTRTAF